MWAAPDQAEQRLADLADRSRTGAGRLGSPISSPGFPRARNHPVGGIAEILAVISSTSSAADAARRLIRACWHCGPGGATLPN